MKREGISYKNLEKTIKLYNEDVAKGRDSEYGRTKLLQTIDTAPYYAFECEPQMYTSYSGLEINKKAQVLNEAGIPIKGLYAAGDVTGHLTYQSGLGGRRNFRSGNGNCLWQNCRSRSG